MLVLKDKRTKTEEIFRIPADFLHRFLLWYINKIPGGYFKNILTVFLVFITVFTGYAFTEHSDRETLFYTAVQYLTDRKNSSGRPLSSCDFILKTVSEGIELWDSYVYIITGETEDFNIYVTTRNCENTGKNVTYEECLLYSRGALGFSRYSVTDGGVLNRCDIILFAEYFYMYRNAQIMKRLAAHEAGHCAGLDHNDGNVKNIMSRTAAGAADPDPEYRKVFAEAAGGKILPGYEHMFIKGVRPPVLLDRFGIVITDYAAAVSGRHTYCTDV